MAMAYGRGWGEGRPRPRPRVHTVSRPYGTVHQRHASVSVKAEAVFRAQLLVVSLPSRAETREGACSTHLSSLVALPSLSQTTYRCACIPKVLICARARECARRPGSGFLWVSQTCPTRSGRSFFFDDARPLLAEDKRHTLAGSGCSLASLAARW